ncbi:hypothetical protein CHS0354_001536 [Potamilus streckersoni]|uniref:Uncharacterized protein n=1 Tax=Potamilus streckersoni TaxID=2493646 RepID=A0AAE0SNJ1_9BIVA|nr:hypothetical protein CHS0354_001536 [Potamilus streckersoni]
MTGTLGQMTLSQSCSDLATCKNDCKASTDSNLMCWAVNCDTSSCNMIFSSSASRLQHADNIITSNTWFLYIRQDPCQSSDCYDAALLGQTKVTISHFQFSADSGQCENKCDTELYRSMPCWGINIINDKCILLFVSDPDFYTYSVNMAVDPTATLKIKKTSGCVPDTTSTTLAIETDSTSTGTSTDYSETSGTTEQTTMNQPDSTTRTQTCACSCQLANLLNQQSLYYNMTHEQREAYLQEQIRQIQEELTVETSNLSATIRKKTSAIDNRTSAKVMGFTLGVCLICLVIGCIIVMDLPNIFDCVRRIAHRLYSSGFA